MLECGLNIKYHDSVIIGQLQTLPMRLMESERLSVREYVEN